VTNIFHTVTAAPVAPVEAAPVTDAPAPVVEPVRPVTDPAVSPIQKDTPTA
jgi:hypothetical protein